MLIHILTHDIILIGCGLGLMCGIVLKIVIEIISKIVEVWDDKSRT